MEEKVGMLSSFITEQEEWLDDWLAALGWTKESLTKPELMQCPHNPHHYLPKSSMEEHVKKCRYAEILNTSIWSLEEDRHISFETDSSFLYQDSSAVESIKIDMAVMRAVKKLARDQPQMGQIPRSHERHVMEEHFSSLESSEISPREIRNQPCTQLISYIKSWKTVPSDFSLMDGSSLNLSQVKGWLFKNLPEKHAHSSVLGGEISMVDSIVAGLMTPPHLQKAKKPNLTPNVLLNRLRPLLGLNTRSLVLSLWRFLHIRKVQEKHSMEDSVVDDILPMALATVDGLRREANVEDDIPSIAELIHGLAKQDDYASSEEFPLPLDCVTQQLSTSERRILYDYVVEVTSRQAFMKLDVDLYRDDMATIRAQMKAQGKMEAAAKKEEEVDTRGKTYLQLLKEKRDYKRRRQKYRAKNVHITRKTPTEIFRTIISNRMEEMRAAMLTDKDTDAHSMTVEPCEGKGLPESEGKNRRVRSKSRERGLECDRHKRRWSRDGDEEGHGHRKRRRKSRSRDRGRSTSKGRGRSRSRDRRRSKSRGRERSRDRRRSKSKGRESSKSRRRRRSKSRERRSKKHKKHRHRSSDS